MAHLGTAGLIPLTFTASGIISVADGWDYLTMDFSAYIHRVTMTLHTTGATSGNNDVVIERTPSGGSAGDLWTVGSGIGRIAYNASAKYLEWDWEDGGWTGYASTQIFYPSGCVLAKGDTLKLNVNAVAAAGNPAGLRLTLWVKPIDA